ncbi:MAG: hypothetical protein IT239_00665 [Bacteroidia bacterium]|nr:hypothetical protein [Bacteroidia bacterium]
MTLDSFFEQSYLPGANTGNTLTIHLSVNQLVLSVKNKEGELLGLKQYFLQENFFSEKGVNELADLFSAISTLSGTFSDVRVCIDTPYLCLFRTIFPIRKIILNGCNINLK